MKAGLRVRIIGIPIVIFLLAIAVNTMLAAWHFREDFSDSLHDNVRTLAQNLKLQAERLIQLGIQVDQIAGFDEQCRDLVGQHPEISYAALVGRGGRVLAHSAPGRAGGRWDDLPEAPEREPFMSREQRGGKTVERQNIALPVTEGAGEVLGWCIVGYPADLIESKISHVTFWSIMTAGILLPMGIILMSLALTGSVTRPLSQLLKAVEMIRKNGTCEGTVQIASDDELGRLARAFNAMAESIRQRDEQILRQLHEVESARDLLEQRVQERTADLTSANRELQAEMERRLDSERKREQMQANLMEASRKAGMADVATGVLHNVGNVLNSINVSTQVVQETVKSSRLSILTKATDLIQENLENLPRFLTADERGRQLPGFLSKLSESLQAERASLLGELESLGSSISHIREIVSMQQSLARVAGVQSEVTLGELLEDALKINQAGLERHHVAICREYDPSIRVCTDRHKVLQILINLISNAKYAVDGNADRPRQVHIRAAMAPGDRIQIAVSDNGVGIDPGVMTRLFSFGFTTKRNGHGFGLHSSVLAAAELGGTLSAHSDGTGQGATFTLVLPVRQEAPAAC